MCSLEGRERFEGKVNPNSKTLTSRRGCDRLGTRLDLQLGMENSDYKSS